MRTAEAKVYKHGEFWEQQLVQYEQKVVQRARNMEREVEEDKIGKIGQGYTVWSFMYCTKECEHNPMG